MVAECTSKLKYLNFAIFMLGKKSYPCNILRIAHPFFEIKISYLVGAGAHDFAQFSHNHVNTAERWLLHFFYLPLDDGLEGHVRGEQASSILRKHT